MSQSAVRLLSLLSLLQGPRTWTGAELAERMQVSPRTVRNDIERLRELGYAVEATRGGVGGYHLGAGGASLPPLLLDAEEAVAVAVGLRTGVNCIIGGMEETSVRALAKLEQVLPAPLRRRIRHLNRYTVPVPNTEPVPVVEPAMLMDLVGACHRRERIRFWYGDTPEDPDTSVRHDAEPYRVVNRRHRWFLLGFDVAGDEWELYEVNRMHPLNQPGPRFELRELPAEDVGAFVARRVPEMSWRHQAEVTVHAGVREVEGAIMPAEGFVDPIDDHSCRLRLGAESISAMALALGRLGVGFTVYHPPELVEEVRALGDRYARAAPELAAVDSSPSEGR
jgi:predicted DNA-binding transcriptional regulator YafY